MNILILNWRDIKNPAGGGAEILTHEIAKRFVKNGNTVTQFSASFSTSKKEEIVDGVKFIRKGKWWTVHIYAFFHYLRNKKKYDVIIDEVHWFPFFAALYAPQKTVALTCEVASRLFFTIFPSVIAYIFLFIEKMYLFLYKNVPTMVISRSTYDDLVSAGYRKEKIYILPMGITIPSGIKIATKESTPTFITVGRLNTQKGTKDVLDAFSLIHKEIPEAKLWFVGSGEKDFIEEMKRKIQKYGIENAVGFQGFVSENEKFLLLSRAWMQLSASRQEGWGLTIPEAGLMKTPSVVYDIEGFRDIIIQNKTGVLVEKTPQSLATAAIRLLNNKKNYTEMKEAIYIQSKKYSWNQTAKEAEEFINKNIKK